MTMVLQVYPTVPMMHAVLAPPVPNDVPTVLASSPFDRLPLPAFIPEAPYNQYRVGDL